MKTSELLRYTGVGVRHLIRSRLLGKLAPLVGGIALNDACNLHCRQCNVSNRGIPDMSFDEICVGLARLHGMGIRVLYIEPVPNH